MRFTQRWYVRYGLALATVVVAVMARVALVPVLGLNLPYVTVYPAIMIAAVVLGVVSGMILAQYAVSDAMSEAHAMVSLIDQGWAEQKEVARAFNCSARSVRRHQRRFEEGGLPALGRTSGYPKGHPRLPASRTRQVTRLKEQGLSNCQIAACMGVSETSVRKVLKRIGWTDPQSAQVHLPMGNGPAHCRQSASAPEAASSALRSDPSASNPNLSAFLTGLLSFPHEPSTKAGGFVSGSGRA